MYKTYNTIKHFVFQLVCRSVADRTNPFVYWDLTAGASQLMECPDGTRYNAKDCRCLHDPFIGGGGGSRPSGNIGRYNRVTFLEINSI